MFSVLVASVIKDLRRWPEQGAFQIQASGLANQCRLGSDGDRHMSTVAYCACFAVLSVGRVRGDLRADTTAHMRHF
jgi:hypothetical protein